MDDATKKILEIVTDVQERMDGMATKDALLNLATKSDVLANTLAIEKLIESVDGMRGYAKEIDTVVQRVTVLEKRVDAIA